MLYVSISAFYVGVGFEVDIIVAAAWAIGVPGLVMYYWVAVQYLSDMRLAITDAGSM